MHKCRLNRAACLLKLQGYGAAGNEALHVIKEDPVNAKAHYRLAQASEASAATQRWRTRKSRSWSMPWSHSGGTNVPSG